MYRRGVSSRTRKLVIGGAAAALLGSALAVGTGMGQAAESCVGQDQALQNNLNFIAGQQANPVAQSQARIANRQAVVDLIQQRRAAAGCTANVQPGGNGGQGSAGQDQNAGDQKMGSDTGSDQSGATGNAGASSGNIDALVPALGFSPGNPNATADREGPTGVKVPGRCPPTQAQVNAQVALKNANFPSGTDLESRIQRFEKTLSAIQDLKCPAASTTLLGRLNSLTALRANANRDNILRGLGLNETPAG